MNSPAFLFYSKDWIADTADWESESKGVYIDLLAHQHVNGWLPNNEKKLAKIARLSNDEFSRIWKTINYKFDHVDDHLVNRRLNQVITENNMKSLKNKITGFFAVKVRTLDVSSKQLAELKKQFDIELFTNISEDNLKDEVYKWVDQTVNHTVDRTVDQAMNRSEDANEDVNSSKKKPIKKSISTPTREEFSAYFIENGYSKELADRAFNGYEAAGWCDSEGKPVRSWRQKAQHVWFRPENKSKESPSEQHYPKSSEFDFDSLNAQRLAAIG